MPQTTIELLRWLERPARVTVLEANGRPKAFLQVTAPLDLRRMCRGRPVEELPRILTIASPAHHIVSAMALDALFKVEPPPLAVNIRKALLWAQFVRHHLRKLFFSLSHWNDPFSRFTMREVDARGSRAGHDLLERMMYHLALLQEAATMLGGRPDHPVSAVPGGVSRFLKIPYYARLEEIGREGLRFAQELVPHLRERVLPRAATRPVHQPSAADRLCSLALTDDGSEVTVKGPDGGLVDRFPTAQFFDKIGVHQESWTYEPFTYLRSGDWPGLDDGNRAQLFFVGPLARLNVADQLDTSLAEAERQRLAETLGPFPRYGVPAAYEALSVELLRAVEKFEGLCKQEQLTGPSIRTIPSEMGREVVAAIEAPEGTIAHRYRVDGHGIVEDVEILDPAAHNNALKCLLTRTIVSAALEANKDLRETKACIELSLLPF